MNKLESPGPKDDPCQIYLKLFHEKKIFEDLSKYFLFSPLLDPQNGQPFIWMNLNEFESAFPKHVFYQTGQVVCEKKSYKGKSWRPGYAEKDVKHNSFFSLDNVCTTTMPGNKILIFID